MKLLSAQVLKRGLPRSREPGSGPAGTHLERVHIHASLRCSGRLSGCPVGSDTMGAPGLQVWVELRIVCWGRAQAGLGLVSVDVGRVTCEAAS